MEKKEHTPVFGVAVAIVSFLGLFACGVVCILLNQALKAQQHELGETRTQLAAVTQALEAQRHDLNEAQKQWGTAKIQNAEAQKKNQSLDQQLTELQTKLRENKAVTETTFPPRQIPAVAPEIPAPDSVEGKLRAEGKNWERAEGPPIPGGYVQDILEGRFDQPKGRGRIGIVVAVANGGGAPAATVDFGHGYIVGIAASELSPVRIIQPDVR